MEDLIIESKSATGFRDYRASGARGQKYWIGIDPGLTGAVGVLNMDGSLHSVVKMPVRDKSGGVVKKEVSAKGLRRVLEGLVSEGDIVLLERVSSRPEQGVAGMFSLGDSFGVVRGVVEGMGGVCVDVLPVMWRKACGVSANSGKGGSISKARLFFDKDVARHASQSLKDHGCADALLIAWYGWKKYLGSQV